MSAQLPKPLPKITVVVPFFRDAPYIADCIRSVLGQNGVEFELIAVDDRGDDESNRIVRDFARQDERIRLIAHDRNRGLAASRNTGLAYATGQFVTFLDGDDFLFSDSLERRARRLLFKSRWNRKIAGSYCGWELVSENASIDMVPGSEAKNVRLRYTQVAGDNPLIATAPMLWRSALVNIGGFDEEFRTAEDFEFWTRLLRQGYELIPTGQVGVAYRQKRSGMIASGLVEHARNAERVFDYIDRHLQTHEVSSRAPAPFVLPLAQHQRNSRWLRRITVFLAIAVAANEKDRAEELISLMSNEMTQTDLNEEIGLDVAIAAGIKRFELQRGVLSDEDKERVATAVREMLALAVDARDGSDPREGDSPEFAADVIRSRATEWSP